jgi:hypothetical protein
MRAPRHAVSARRWLEVMTVLTALVCAAGLAVWMCERCAGPN